MSYAEDRAVRQMINNTKPCPDCTRYGFIKVRGNCSNCNGKGRIQTHVQLDPLSGRIPLQELNKQEES